MPTDFRDFQDILTDLDDGHVHEELTHQLREVVRACRTAKRAGSLTLKIDIRPEGERQFVINASVKPNIPTPKPGITMFFASDEGDLRKEDPKQIPLKHVDQRGGRVLREVEFNTEGKGG